MQMLAGRQVRTYTYAKDTFSHWLADLLIYKFIACFLSSAIFSMFVNHSFRTNITVSNGLDPDQA